MNGMLVLVAALLADALRLASDLLTLYVRRERVTA